MRKIFSKFNFRKILIFVLWISGTIAIFAGVSFAITRVNQNYVYFFIIFLYLINLIFVIIMINSKSYSDSKFSWILFILILPIFGHIFYLIFGLKSKSNRFQYLESIDKYEVNSYLDKATLNVKKTSDYEFHKLENFFKTKMLSCDFEFLDTGNKFFENLFKELKKTKKSISIITFIIKPGVFADKFIEILKEKAQQGIKVQWLIDDYGSILYKRKKINDLRKVGVEIYFINKIYWPVIWKKTFIRNHSKFIIIDSKMVFNGGSNISDEYAGFSKRFGNLIDLNYKISGPYVNNYILNFAKLWKFSSNTDIDIKESLFKDDSEKKYKNLALFCSENPFSPESKSEIYWTKLMQMAKYNIKIATPYFSVTKTLFNQIVLTLKSGIDVEIYIPGLPDKKIPYEVSLNELFKLKEYGLKIYIYSDHFVHTKMGLIDHKYAWSGSNNWDIRSMHMQFETMEIFSGLDTKFIENLFEQYKSKSRLLDSQEYLKKTNPIKTFVLNWIKPLI